MRPIIAICLLGGLCYVSGYGTYRNDLPNGERVFHPCKPNTFWRGVGHRNAAGGGSRNQFGIDFNNYGKKWTRELCMKDSDGDGKTNGEELGDPDCVWVNGTTPTRIEDITHPGVCTPFYDSHCEGRNDWVDCANEEFVCPALNRSDTQNFTLRFNRTQVPPQETTYKCMIFEVPSDEDYHIVATRPEIDNDNVMHHIILSGCADTEEPIPDGPYNCNMGAGYNCFIGLGGWTLGVPGDCLNENFGMLFGKTRFKRMALEFHWNNPKRESSWYDSSGMTVFFTKNLRPNNGAILMLGQMHLEIPPGKPSTTFTSTCPGECTAVTLSEPIYVPAAMNHMHYLGKSQSVEQRRNGSRLQWITNDESYSYDNPQYHRYDTPLEILPNDELITTCEYDSRVSAKWVYNGDSTSEEMCYAFLWFYPAEAVLAPTCVSWKSITVCSASEAAVNVSGCNAWEFIYFLKPSDGDLYLNVEGNCTLDGHCHEDCKLAVMEAKQHPCLRGGDITDYVISQFQHSKEGLQFLRKLDMCTVKDDDIVCPVGSGSRSRSAAVMLLVIAVIFFRIM